MAITRSIVGFALAALVVVACGGAQPGTDTACPSVQVSGPDQLPLDLSGAWSGNDDGVYYIKQIGTCIWWTGLSNFDGQYPGEEWIMTFRGDMNSDGMINGDFVDVKSTNPGSGTITIEARIDPGEGGSVVNLYRVAATGHPIGVTFWQRTSEPVGGPTAVPEDGADPT